MNIRKASFRIRTVIVASSVAALLGLVTPVSAFVRGDANGDTSIDISDPIRILSSLFVAGEPPLYCEDAGDANDDGNLDISDPIYLLSFLFVAGSPPPPVPFPDDGSDPTPDGLIACDPVGGPLDFEVLAEGYSSGAADTFVIFRDEASFAAFWATHVSIFIPAPPEPVVDFDTEMVVVIVENHTSGGFFVHIDELIATVDGIEVYSTAGAPLSGCPTTDALTQPHSIVVAPLTPGDPIAFSTLVDSCP